MFKKIRFLFFIQSQKKKYRESTVHPVILTRFILDTAWRCLIYPTYLSRLFLLPQSVFCLPSKFHELSFQLLHSVSCGGWIKLVVILALSCCNCRQNIAHFALPAHGGWAHESPENQNAWGGRMYFLWSVRSLKENDRSWSDDRGQWSLQWWWW